MILIIGGDSAIGAALAAHFEAVGIEHVTTTRRPGANAFLDLRQPPHRFSKMPVAALLCAAVTSLAACAERPSETAQINVEGSLAWANHLAAEGCFVAGLSTNLVFDGAAPSVASETATAPHCEYGRQKAELERGLLELGPLGAVVRLTKVLQSSVPLLDRWIAALAAGNPVQAFGDMSFAPIGIRPVVGALAELLVSRRFGIFQLSAIDDYSYADAARQFARALGREQALVESVTSGLSPPRYTSLDTARSQVELGWRPVSGHAALSVYLAAKGYTRTSNPALRSQDE